MIILFHKNNKVVKIYDFDRDIELNINSNTIQNTLILIAKKNPEVFVGWCHVDLKNDINLEAWEVILKHPLLLISYETSTNYYITSDIGFVEDSPFINVNKNVEYPTWLMSSDVGVIHASVLLEFENLLNYNLSFDLFLNCMAKSGMSQGLLCYSNPNLLKGNFIGHKIQKEPISKIDFLWFVKSNYRLRWIVLYLANLLIFKKQFPIVSFFGSFFKKQIQHSFSLTNRSFKINVENKKINIDVLIPTLGREKELKNVLVDLSKQTVLPKKVIIVEQNAIKNEGSKLDYLKEAWPFAIDHTLIHQLGACNARNLALEKVTSEWVFFADDDIRFNSSFLEDAFKFLFMYDANVVNLSCLQKGEKELKSKIVQSTSFGSGTSILKSESIKNMKFNMAYEFGYGEDADFGMQLRNKGVDVLYIPFVSMIHLKAPIGGFRQKIKREWDSDIILPKPSPTIMVYKLMHATKEQLQSYKIILFLKFYKNQPIKNPMRYYKMMSKAWDRSLYWAHYLIKNNN
jgi:glycosyltransferase involved in cell wall biosynthesis